MWLRQRFDNIDVRVNGNLSCLFLIYNQIVVTTYDKNRCFFLSSQPETALPDARSHLQHSVRTLTGSTLLSKLKQHILYTLHQNMGRTDFDKYMKICLSNTKYKMCYKEKITYIRNIVIQHFTTKYANENRILKNNGFGHTDYICTGYVYKIR